MESPNSLYNNINNASKDGLESSDNIVIPSNFLISNKEIIARFPHNKRVGHYLLGRKLGEGSFAKVKEGLHTLTGQKVAIKVIDKKKAKEDAYVSKNMRREGKLLQMIIHPNIIQLYELMETENSYYLVTELCEGGDLMDYICARKYLSETCTRKFIRQIISAVDYLHRIGILHRDLKIENLLLDKNLNIKLIDFGLSNYTKSELCITQCGSPAYAAPELLAHKKYGSKVDVWSIGVNMYAMLTGNLPFTVEPFNIKALYNKMMKNEMNSIPEHLSKNGEDLLRKLLNPDPTKRISLKEAMEHPWINEGFSSSLKPFPYPNKPTEDQVNPTILRYMNTNMEFNVNEVAESIKLNKPSSALATYYLLLNKVKTMLLKIDPKSKEKVKPRNDTSKPIIKDIRQQTKTPTQQLIANTNNQQPQSPNQQQQQQHTLPTIPNAQSPIPRSIKQNGTSNNISSTLPANLVRNSTSSKLTDANLNNKSSNASKQQTDRNMSPLPANTINATFAGAIKNLTQKYKAMHLTNSVDNQLNTARNLNSSTPSNISNNSNTAYKTSTFSYQQNNLIDQGINNSSNSSAEATNNSDSVSLSDDNKLMKQSQTANNRNSIATPTFTKMVSNNSFSTQAEWTQMVKLHKAKSDLNNNDINRDHSNSTNHSSSHNENTISNDNLNSISLNTPISYQSTPGRLLTKSPIVKKMTSPITLPSIDAGRVTPLQ